MFRVLGGQRGALVRCFHYIGGRGGGWRGQVMVALSQLLVSVPTAVRVRAWRGVRRVVRSMLRPLAVSWTRRMRLSSRSARAALRCWWSRSGSRTSALARSQPDEGLDDGGVDAHGDVASDSVFGPVPHRSQVQEVLEDPEAGFDACELAVGGHDSGGAGLCGCEAGGEHVAAGEELLVCVGVFVVVVGEAARCDLEVEEPPGWFDGPLLTAPEPAAVAKASRSLQRERRARTAGSVVSALNLGFWVALFKSKYDTTLWCTILYRCFDAGAAESRQRPVVGHGHRAGAGRR